MGGYASGRWFGHDKKTTIEDCHALDLGVLERDGAFAPWRSGRYRWLVGERETGSIGYRVEQRHGGQHWLVLDYVWGEAKERVVIPVALETTRPHFGGVRWWGRCPLAVNGVACNRRARKLYLRGRYFGCRHCHNLTYKSCQESHQRDWLYSRLAERLGTSMRDVKRLHRGWIRDAQRQ
ncbi:MAG TPA: hypothetical protein PK867_13285 [Pirellulales bacterium]|nr:hypothetical protein [Pirellulales bacterium]